MREDEGEEGEAAPSHREPQPLIALPASPNSLSARERELLAQIASGASNQEIGDRLSISKTTVATHATNIYKKLGVRNRTEAAARFFSSKASD